MLTKGITVVSVAAVRSEPSHRAEMISQLLYGESVDILREDNSFVYIRMHFDGYEGWVSRLQITPVTDEVFAGRTVAVLETHYLQREDILLSAGSEVPAEVAEQKKMNLTIKETAETFLGVPYLWSGRSFFGLDCSGFVQLVYKLHGFTLPRDAAEQAKMGNVLSFVEESKSGDLAFFEDEEGTITHVGLMLDQQKIIHAYGKVRIDQLDSTGIYNSDENRHTHKLRFLRSVL